MYDNNMHVERIKKTVDTVVCTPDDGRRYHPKHVEKFPDINKLYKVASCWIYIGIYLQCTDPFTLTILLLLFVRYNTTGDRGSPWSTPYVVRNFDIFYSDKVTARITVGCVWHGCLFLILYP